MDFQLFVVYANLAMYAFCFQMQQPVLPATVKALVVGDDSAQEWAQFQSMNGMMQLGGGLVSGVLADKFGSKNLLLLSFAASALCYLLQAQATTMNMLYVSQIPTVFQHAFMGAAAFITDRTEPKERAHMLGFNAVAYGVGMLFGPVLGGWLGQTDLTTSAWIAAVGSVLSCASIQLLLSDERKFTPSSKASEPPEPFSLAACLAVITQPAVLVLAAIKVGGAMAMSIWHSTFYGGIAESEFGIDTQMLGVLTSYMAAVGMVVQVCGLVKYVTGAASDRTINIAVGCMLAVVFLAAPLTTAGKDTPVVVPVVGYTTNLACLQFMGLLIPITAAFTLIRSISTAQFTKSVSKATTGTIIGIDMGIGSAVRIFAPLIGGAVQGEGGLTAIAQLCAALCVVMAVLSALMMDAAAPDKAKQG
jgi:predicted MFS family arabinose efflux permease|eukprot:COSAG06_NODE_5065_length_3752_cov_2.977149_1_plen_418_part_00